MHKNIAQWERIASVTAGALTLASIYSTFRKHPVASTVTAAAGLGLLLRGASGRCAVYQSLGIGSSRGKASLTDPMVIDKAVLVNRPVADIVAYLLTDAMGDKRFIHGPGEMEFHREVDGLSFQLNLAPQHHGVRTLMHMNVKSTAGSPLMNAWARRAFLACEKEAEVELRAIRACVEVDPDALRGSQRPSDARTPHFDAHDTLKEERSWLATSMVPLGKEVMA